MGKEVRNRDFQNFINAGFLNQGGQFNTVSIYPKPADQKINLSFNKTFESAITVKLFDLNGKEVQRATIAPQKEPINYALDFDMKITPGMYIISISSGTYRHSEKIIVK